MFVYANNFTYGTGRVLGVFLLLAGLVGAAYSRFNSRIDPNNFWVTVHALNDLVFGVVFIVMASKGIKGFIDMIGFWAVVYAFVQAVRAMYVALMEGGSSLAMKLIHFLSVAVAGYLAFNTMLRPIGLIDSLGITGFFPIALGILVILTARLTVVKPNSIAR